MTEIQNLNTERNSLTEQIGALIRDKKVEEANKIRTKVQEIKNNLSSLEKELQEVNEQLDLILHSIPNIPHDSVPIGKDEKDNVEIRK
jgi:seryl-tRNA synthetase